MDSKLIILKLASSQNRDYYENAIIKILNNFDFFFIQSEKEDTITISLYNGYRLWKYMDLTGYTIDMDYESFDVPKQLGDFAECMKEVVVKPYRPVFNNSKQMSAIMDGILSRK
jgi:hypothetical protein